MKKQLILLLLLLLLSSLWIGCRPDPSLPDDGNTPSIEVKDEMGNSVEFESFEAWIVGEIINIKAVTKAKESLNIFISPVVSVIGQHELNAKSNWVTFIQGDTETQIFGVDPGDPARSGFVSIDSRDENEKRLSLSISLELVRLDGKGMRTLKGVFSNQPYVEESPYEENTFSCLVNGTAQKVDRLVVEHNTDEFYIWVLDADTEQLVSLNFPYSPGQGAYIMKPFSTTVRGDCKIDLKQYPSSLGYLILEYYDPVLKQLKGRFEFAGKASDSEEAQVKDGTFFVQYN